MCEIDAGGICEQHSAEMDATASAGRCIVEFARLRFGERDQLLNVARGQRLVHQNNQGTGGDQANRREILARVVSGIRIKRRIDGKRTGAAEPERVAVRGGLGDLAGADRAAGTAMVFDHQRLAKHLGHGFSNCARQHIVAASRRIRNDQCDWMIWIA